MNKQTAASIYDGMSDDEKDAVLGMKAKGVKGIDAIKKVHAEKLAGVTAESKRDLLQPEADGMDQIEAAGTGAAKFLTGGATDAAAGVGAGLATGIEALTQGKGLGDVVDDVKAGYREGRGERRAYEEEQFQKAPEAYSAGGVVGALTGGAVGGKAAKSMTLGERSLLNAGQGAASGYGMSDSDSVMGDLLSMLGGAALGGAAPLVVPGIQALRGAPKAAKEAIKGPVGAGLKKTAVEMAGDTPVLRKLGKLKTNIAAEKAAAGRHPIAPGVVPKGATAVGVDDLAGYASREGVEAPPLMSIADEAVGPAAPSGLELARPPAARMADEAMSVIDDEMGLARALSEDAPEEIVELVTKKAAAPASPVSAAKEAIDEVDEVVKPKASPSGKRTEREWRMAEDSEKAAAIEDAFPALQERWGDVDAGSMAQATGLSSSDVRRLLPDIARRIMGVSKPGAPAQGVRGRQRASSQFDPEAAKKQVAAGKEAGPKATRAERAHRAFR